MNTDFPFLELLEPAVAADYLAWRNGQGWYKDSSKALIEVRGEDIREWLQGQVTNDVRKLEPGAPLRACMCTATGQLLAEVTLHDVGDSVLIEVDSQNLRAVMQRIEKMVVMEDVEGKDLTPQFKLFVSGKLPEDHPEGTIAVNIGAHWHCWVPIEAAYLFEGPEVCAQAVEIARLEDGVPVFGKDMNERTLPPELGSAFEHSHISYAKGCYTGQEVLMRIHSRGHTNKTWVRFVADGPIEPGQSILNLEGNEVGKTTSFAMSPRFGCLGAGLVKNEWAASGVKLRIGERVAEVVFG